MNKPDRYERPLLRRAILGAVFGVLGAFISRFVLTRFNLAHAFRDVDPWVGPAIFAGFIGTAVLAAMVLPLLFQRRRKRARDA